MEKILIDQIIIGDRFRHDMGDLGALADSIREQGLLSPPGINEYNQLVFGQRRVLACRDVLGWTEIEFRRVEVTSIVEGEFAENEIRKQFNNDERLAIAAAVEEELGNRRGQRTDLELVADRPEVEKGKRTRDLAAKRAGFGSATTMRRVKAVHDSGDKGLIEDLDSGRITPTAAEVKLQGFKGKHAVEKRNETRRLLNLVKDLPAGRMLEPRKPAAPVDIVAFLTRITRVIGNLLRNDRYFKAIIKHKESLAEDIRRESARTLRNFANELLGFADELYEEQNGKVLDGTCN